LGYEGADCSLLLVDDRRMAEFNACYRGRKRTTDVLSFPMGEGMGKGLHPQILGDVVISVEAARRQAHVLGHSLEMELSTLLIHGILHLVGYHHHRAEERRRAMRLQEEFLRRYFPTVRT